MRWRTALGDKQRLWGSRICEENRSNGRLQQRERKEPGHLQGTLWRAGPGSLNVKSREGSERKRLGLSTLHKGRQLVKGQRQDRSLQVWPAALLPLSSAVPTAAQPDSDLKNKNKN